MKAFWRRMRWLVLGDPKAFEETARRLEVLQGHLALEHLTLIVRDRAVQEQRDLWMERLGRYNAEQHQVLTRVATALEHPAWDRARQAVRECATTLGFNDPDAWRPYSRTLKQDPGQAENVFRHVKAVHALREALGAEGVLLSNPEAHLLVELAYHGFSALGQ